MTTKFAIILAIIPVIYSPSIVVGQATTAPPDGVIIRCPDAPSVAAVADKVPQGWRVNNLQYTVFGRAVIKSQGNDVHLTCEYKIGGSDQVTALDRKAPAGHRCTVNTAKGNQFDCVPFSAASVGAATRP